jgi:putative (di)nucleoside polyphosphate hydrolase
MANMHIMDNEGYRLNVGIVLCNEDSQVFWARRVNHDGWQFPQGGVRRDETAEAALFRELYEEVGLTSNQVEIVGRTREWLRYDLPSHFRRQAVPGKLFRGQKQRWYLLRMLGDDSDIRLDLSRRPEFDDWRWVDYWLPLERIVEFKRPVYKRALYELASLLGTD